MTNGIGRLDPRTLSFTPHTPDVQEGAHCVVPVLRWLSETIAVVINDGPFRARPTAIEVVGDPTWLVRVLGHDDRPTYHRLPEPLRGPAAAERQAWVEALARRHGYRWG